MAKIPHATVWLMIADGESQSRQSLVEMLRNAEFDLIECAEPAELTVAVDSEHPGCLVLEHQFGDTTALETWHRLTAAGCGLPLIVVAEPGATASAAVDTLHAGAVDFLVRPVSERQLIRRVHEAVTRDRLARDQRLTRREVEERMKRLTVRQRQVLDLVVTGLSSKEIGAQLGIATKTVDVHRSQVLKKMEARSAAGLVRLLDAAGLIQ